MHSPREKLAWRPRFDMVVACATEHRPREHLTEGGRGMGRCHIVPPKLAVTSSPQMTEFHDSRPGDGVMNHDHVVLRFFKTGRIFIETAPFLGR